MVRVPKKKEKEMKKRKRNEGTIESVEMIKYCGGDQM